MSDLTKALGTVVHETTGVLRQSLRGMILADVCPRNGHTTVPDTFGLPPLRTFADVASQAIDRGQKNTPNGYPVERWVSAQCGRYKVGRSLQLGRSRPAASDEPRSAGQCP